MAKLAFTNVRIIDPASGFDGPGELMVDGETIADFGANLFGGSPPNDAKVIDGGGHVLAPGLVDMRVQLREPGEEHKETIKSASQAAVKGGVTTMVALPNTNPVADDPAVVEYVARKARLLSLAKVFVYGAATKGLRGEELAEIGLLKESGALAFTDGTQSIANAGVMKKALSYADTFGTFVIQHAEEPSLSGGVMNAGDTATRLGLAGIPREAEIIMLERDLRLVEMTGAQYHAAHISTAASVDLIAHAKIKGLKVTCDTAPFYFGLNELSVTGYRSFAKLSPPLRSEDDRQAIAQGVQDGTIDIIASDHAPQDQDTKRLPFAHAAFGGSGLETLLAASLELYHSTGLPLIDILAKLTSAPADLLGLDVGRLSKGAPADMVLFNPDTAWKVVADDFLSKSKNSPFDGRPVQGKVLRTVVDGRTVFEAP